MAYRVCVPTDCSEKPSAFTLQCVTIHVSKRLWERQQGKALAAPSSWSLSLWLGKALAGGCSWERLFRVALPLPEPVPVVERGSSSGDAAGHYTAKHNSVGGRHNFGKWRTMKGLYSGTYPPPQQVCLYLSIASQTTLYPCYWSYVGMSTTHCWKKCEVHT